MEPFKVPAPFRELTNPYASAADLLDAARRGGEEARIGLARLWLSEGIPFAFREHPALYEAVRTWLSIQLDVHAKEISLTGSARLGSSLAPRQVGKPFDASSDLDLFIVSGRLFDRVKDDFVRWSIDFERGAVKPRNTREEGFWKSNYSRGHKLIERGFLDSKMIPNLSSYPTTKKVSQLMWLLVEKLKVTVGAPRPSQASVRCYASWSSYIRQICISLR